jgi:hypothetical protein
MGEWMNGWIGGLMARIGDKSLIHPFIHSLIHPLTEPAYRKIWVCMVSSGRYFTSFTLVKSGRAR